MQRCKHITGMTSSLLLMILRDQHRQIRAYLDDLIVDSSVEDAGHKTSTNALDLVGAGGTSREDGALARLNGHNMHRLLALQELSRACDGAARADAAHEDINLCTSTYQTPLSTTFIAIAASHLGIFIYCDTAEKSKAVLHAILNS